MIINKDVQKKKREGMLNDKETNIRENKIFANIQSQKLIPQQMIGLIQNRLIKKQFLQ